MASKERAKRIKERESELMNDFDGDGEMDGWMSETFPLGVGIED